MTLPHAVESGDERPRRLRLRPDERRERILEATERVLVTCDAEHVTIEAIAAEANVAKGTMYHYWPSRADLFKELGQRYVDVMLAFVASFAENSEESPVGALERFLRDAAEFHYRRRLFLGALNRQMPINDEQIVGPLSAVFRTLAGSAGAGGGPGESGPALDLGFAVSFLLVGLHGVLMDILHRPDADLELIVSQSHGVCLRVLGLSQARQAAS